MRFLGYARQAVQQMELLESRYIDDQPIMPPDQHHSCCYFIGMRIQHIEIKVCGYGDAFQKFR